MITLDTCGLSCPQPVLMLLQQIKKDAADVLVVIVDNEASLENVTRAAQNNGYVVSKKDLAESTELTLIKE